MKKSNQIDPAVTASISLATMLLKTLSASDFRVTKRSIKVAKKWKKTLEKEYLSDGVLDEQETKDLKEITDAISEKVKTLLR